MRQRTRAVQVRVSEKEKQYICRNARRCGLSLSAYLRKCSLGKDVYSIVPPALYRRIASCSGYSKSGQACRLMR